MPTTETFTASCRACQTQITVIIPAGDAPRGAVIPRVDIAFRQTERHHAALCAAA